MDMHNYITSQDIPGLMEYKSFFSEKDGFVPIGIAAFGSKVLRNIGSLTEKETLHMVNTATPAVVEARVLSDLPGNIESFTPYTLGYSVNLPAEVISIFRKFRSEHHLGKQLEPGAKPIEAYFQASPEMIAMYVGELKQ